MLNEAIIPATGIETIIVMWKASETLLTRTVKFLTEIQQLRLKLSAGISVKLPRILPVTMENIGDSNRTVVICKQGFELNFQVNLMLLLQVLN